MAIVGDNNIDKVLRDENNNIIASVLTESRKEICRRVHRQVGMDIEMDATGAAISVTCRHQWTREAHRAMLRADRDGQLMNFLIRECREEYGLDEIVASFAMAFGELAEGEVLPLPDQPEDEENSADGKPRRCMRIVIDDNGVMIRNYMGIQSVNLAKFYIKHPTTNVPDAFSVTCIYN